MDYKYFINGTWIKHNHTTIEFVNQLYENANFGNQSIISDILPERWDQINNIVFIRERERQKINFVNVLQWLMSSICLLPRPQSIEALKKNRFRR
jgi:hypothetical protein